MAETKTPIHEYSDVNVRAVLGFGLGLIVVAILVHGLVWLMFDYFSARAETTARQYPLAAGESSRLPPEPRLQTNPREDLRELREGEDRLLTEYQWVDRNAGIVRIPITDAMRLTIERGLPSREASAR
jgi:hypothetical protein